MAKKKARKGRAKKIYDALKRSAKKRVPAKKKKKKGKKRLKKLHLIKIRVPKKKKRREKYSSEMGELLKKMERNIDEPNVLLIQNVFGFLAKVNPIVRAHKQELIKKAFTYSRKKHGRQKRASGDPYFTHLIGTAMIISDYNVDTETVAAALLHDVLEDTDAGEEEIVKEFGGEVAALVSSVTRLDKIAEKRKDNNQAKYLRQLMRASSKDFRVLLIKLADKLHNLRTIGFLPGEKRKGICRQALEVYAPLARELGFQEIQWEIEDICFRILHPREYRELEKRVSKKRKEKEKEVEKAIEMIRAEMDRSKKKASQRFKFEKHCKNLYYVYRKIMDANKTTDELYDYVALAIAANSVDECYEALRFVHKTFYPIPMKLKDLISIPGPFNSRAIHTSVIGPAGNPLKVHIQTREKRMVPRFGSIFAGARAPSGIPAGASFRVPEIKSFKDDEFLDALKSDYLERRINVFTEKGDVVSMPTSSTLLDFAFKVSPHRALRTSGGTVNGKRVPLWERLRSGDRASVLFASRETAKQDWLEFACSYEAKEAIGDFLKTPVKGIELSQPVCITIIAENKPALLAEIGRVFFELNVSIDSMHGQRASDKTIKGSFTLLVKNRGQLEAVGKKLSRIRGVKRIELD